MEKAVIIGAGPAGLCAALALLRETDIKPVVIESEARVGGISATIDYKNNRMDIGGHRFFSKSDEVTDFWLSFMPLEGSAGGSRPNPREDERVMLTRERVSRIYYLRRFFDYPVSLSLATLTGLGFWRTMAAGFGYISARLKKRPERTLEDFMINRFGGPLYRMFFEDYTRKVWGVHPSGISADWGAQRIKGLSISKAVVTALTRSFSKKSGDIAQKSSETSLIERFLYPKLGPGQLWQAVAGEVRRLGGEIHMETKAVGVELRDGRFASVTAKRADGERFSISGEYLLSSMPIKDLCAAVTGERPPKAAAEAAAGLPYRDFMTVGLLCRRMKLAGEKKVTPDCWIYIQERDVKIGRLQIFNNWSPYLVADPENTVWLGLEYFCDEGDDMWRTPDPDFIAFAAGELEKIGIIDRADVLDGVVVRVPKAYPAYFGTYSRFGEIRAWLDSVPNLFCIGRNGQHRYNNMDHSMLTAAEAVRCIREKKTDKSALWGINSDDQYHEARS